MKQLSAVCLLGLLVGCQQDSIRAQSVPKPPDPAVRVLAVMVPRADATWFFKLSGPAQVVRAQEDAFKKFIDSVQFADADPPVRWSLPEGWSNGPAHRQRFATLRTDSGVEITVTSLGPEAKDIEKNVNRWRGQIGLPPVDAAELAKTTRPIKVGNGDATWVEMENPGPTPIALRPGDAGRIDEQPTASPQQQKLAYQVPSGWESLPASQMRLAAFRAGVGELAAEITVIALDGAAGGLVDNVNRWRGQLKLPNLAEPAILSATKELMIEDQPAQYVDLLAPEGPKRERMLIVFTERGNRTWFIKMRGPAETVARQQSAFESFARSMRFPTESKDG